MDTEQKAIADSYRLVLQFAKMARLTYDENEVFRTAGGALGKYLEAQFQEEQAPTDD